MNNAQEIYINLDDSGKLTNSEKISVYGGQFFYQQKKKTNLLLNIEVLLIVLSVNIVKVIKLLVIMNVLKQKIQILKTMIKED